jgi:hypothetical protein
MFTITLIRIIYLIVANINSPLELALACYLAKA